MSVLNINSGIHAGGHASPRKVCDENKRKKIKRQPRKYFLLEGGLYKAVSEDWLVNFDELRVTDSTLNEGTNSLINERKVAGLMVRRALSQNESHKTRNG